MLKTPLYAEHIDAGARMVPFGDWQMPLHYGSQIEEHLIVRNDVGMFDTSHMAVIDIKGRDAQAFLAKILANDIAKITQQPGKALYSCLLNEKGGVIDDLIVYFVEDKDYRLIVNASTWQKDLQWLLDHRADHEVQIIHQQELAMLALQGPNATERLTQLLNPPRIKRFNSIRFDDYFIARTGYTGEDGYELIASAETILDVWQRLSQQGVQPCGLGARDTLRLEAGMNLYGNDMDENTSPLVSGLSWTIDFSTREFIGKSALLEQKQQGIEQQFVGLILEGRGVLRAHQEVKINDSEISGVMTSGGFSPSMKQSIGFARIPLLQPPISTKHCLVKIRQQWQSAKIVSLPFVRLGNILV